MLREKNWDPAHLICLVRSSQRHVNNTDIRPTACANSTQPDNSSFVTGSITNINPNHISNAYEDLPHFFVTRRQRVCEPTYTGGLVFPLQSGGYEAG